MRRFGKAHRLDRGLRAWQMRGGSSRNLGGSRHSMPCKPEGVPEENPGPREGASPPSMGAKKRTQATNGIVCVKETKRDEMVGEAS